MKRQHWLSDQRGDTMVLTVFGVIGMLAILGAVFNFGFLAYNKTQLQNAADAAALAGANVLVPNPQMNQSAASAAAVAMAKLAPGQPTDVVDTPQINASNGTTTIVVKISRKVYGAMFSKQISATATAQIVPAGGINHAPANIIKLQDLDYTHAYSERMYDPYGKYTNCTVPNTEYEYDYADVVFHQNTGWDEYEDLCKYGDPNLLHLTDPLYYYAPSESGPESVENYNSQLDQSEDFAKKNYKDGVFPTYDESTQQYVPPLQAGDPRIQTIPVVTALPDRNTPVYTNVPFVGFAAFVIDSFNLGVGLGDNVHDPGYRHTEDIYDPQTKSYYKGYPHHTVTGHFVRLAVSGVPAAPGTTGMGISTVQLVTNDHPENDY